VLSTKKPKKILILNHVAAISRVALKSGFMLAHVSLEGQTFFMPHGYLLISEKIRATI
jgi:hypothetical protein